MAVVYVQLIVDNVDRGVHGLVIPIRDYVSHDVMPGVIIGDCGKKLSLEGIDNGFLLFKDYRVPYDCLLDKLSSITPEGEFRSAISSKDKRLGIMLGGLIRGRISVVGGSEINLRNALTIALRFSAIRKQFSNASGPEVPVMDYQLQKYRLIPHLAKVFAMRSGVLYLVDEYKTIRDKAEANPECIELAEFHAILSAFKSIASSYAMPAIQQCREATGGLGFSVYTGLGRLRSNQDIQLTWEGDNSVLIQQAGKYILKQVQRSFKGNPIAGSTLSYFNANSETVRSYKASFTSVEELLNENLIIELLENRVNYLIHETILKLQENTGSYGDMMEVWNNSQVHHIQDLGYAYGECMFAKLFLDYVKSLRAQCGETAKVIQKFFYLYAVERIEKNLATFLEFGVTPVQAKVVKKAVIDLCNDVSDISIKIIDAIATPDKILGSTLGSSDGQIYKNMIKAVESSKRVYEKAEWVPLILKMREIK